MCSLKLVKEGIADLYDWPTDVLSDHWDEQAVCSKILEKKDSLLCDILMDQEVFAGVSNVIRNEVLYSAQVHPLSTVGAIRRHKLTQLIKEVRKYSYEYLEWKKNCAIKAQCKVYRQDQCPRHEIPLHIKSLGKSKRNIYYCEKCQMLYI